MKEKEFSGEIDSTPDMTLLETEDPHAHLGVLCSDPSDFPEFV